MSNTNFELVEIKTINTGSRFRKHFDRDKLNELKLSIETSGLLQPIVLMKYPERFDRYDYFLIAGERRLRACQELGHTTIPAVYTTERLDGHSIRLNELTENLQREPFTWSEEVRLKAEVHRLYIEKHGEKTSTHPKASGHSKADTAKLFHETAQNMRSDLELAMLLEKNPEIAKKFATKTEAKRRIKLAKKRIELEETVKKKKDDEKIDKKADALSKAYINGDFFEVSKKMQDGLFHLINHDIDYPIDIRDEGALHTKFNKDKKSGAYKGISKDKYPELMQSSIKECYRLLRPNGWLIVWFGFEYYEFIKQSLLDTGFLVNHSLGFWHKNISITRNPDYFLGRSLEPFFYARKGKATILKIHADTYNYNAVAPDQRSHPFEKSIPLCAEILRTFTIPGATILDAFAGSGNMLLAAANTQRDAFGIELSEKYKKTFDLRVHAKPYGEY